MISKGAPLRQFKASGGVTATIGLYTVLLMAASLGSCSDDRISSNDSADTRGDSSGFQAGCAPGSRRCDGNTVMVCAADGLSFTAANTCSDDLVCMQGVCKTCSPGTPFCQGNQVAQCDSKGVVSVLNGCPDACAAGVCVTCIPGRRECRQSVFGGNEAWVCLATGTESSDWSLQERCAAEDDCSNGLCIGPCQDDVKIDTSQGCDYYAVDLENASRQPGDLGDTLAAPQFAVLAYNPSRDNALSLSVFRTPTGLEPDQSVSIPPRTLHVLELEPRQIRGTILDTLAWRIRGDHPFAAYQFNPLDNVNPVFSNDASLLLPVNALGRTYRAMTGVGGSPFISIVATTSDTKINVTPTATIEASGANAGIEAIPSIQANETVTFTLQSGHVLNLRATTDPTADLTGTLIAADRSISVFTGNVATTTSDRCCADHLEQQLPPVTSWGTQYVAARSQPRGAEPDHWTVLAHEDDTVITSSNNLFPPKTLSAGERQRFTTDADFTLYASKPVLVGQFLASSFEVLELGDFCYSDEDCSQSTCSDNTSTGGRCSDTCVAARAECAASELCIDRRLYSQEAGGTCRYQPCGDGLPSCNAGAECISGPNLDVCVEACDGVGATCSNVALICQFSDSGNLCLGRNCTGDDDCNGLRCESTTEGLSQCVMDCTPSSGCPDGHACLPGGYAKDSNDGGYCVAVDTCTNDNDCPAGQTCTQTGAVKNCQPVGDPAFTLSVPVEQWRTGYTFLAPTGFREDYVNIVFPMGADVSIDGQPVGPGLLIADTEYRLVRVRVEDGPHSVAADVPVGVTVYGYDDDVSYAYPAGANLFKLDDD